MATLSKSLKDSSGNIILPKTRSENVYRPNNESIETSLTNIDSKVNTIPTIDKSGMIYNCTHSKSGTTHILSNSNIPTTATQNLVHLSFTSTADYIAGDTFTINSVVYTPKTASLEAPPANIFKNGTLVNIDINLSTKLCFFKLGGSSTPPIPEEPTDEPASYGIIQAFTVDTTWIVPETKWYRIIAVGKSGNGGAGGGATGHLVGANGGIGAGGNAGGIVVSTLYLEKDVEIPITVNSSVTSFGSDISATAGGNGGTGGYGGTDNKYGSPGTISPQYGDAYGGNKVNITGMRGFSQITLSSDPNHQYQYWGGWYKSDLTYINQYFVPSNTLDQYCAYGSPGKSYSQWFNLHVLLSGGGGGGSGGYTGEESNRGAYQGGAGQPGVCIIEKALK